jgi:mannose-1-phosphate guanylyltransferase
MSTLALDVWPGAAVDDGFCEKPAADVARAFQDAGAFWNTFIPVSPVEALKTVGAAMLPVVWLQSA